MDYIRNLISDLNISSLGFGNIATSFTKPEFLFSGIALVFLLLYGISLGRTRALLSLLGIYIAYVFNETFVYFNQLYSWIPVKNISLIRVGLFILVYAVIFFILNRSLVKTRLTLKEASFISVFFISILQLGLLISIIANLLGPDIVGRFPSIFKIYFGTKTALFYWSIIPLVGLIFMRNKG